MGDARLIQPTVPASANRAAGLPAQPIAPSEATRAVLILLRYGWVRVREHVRHSLPWMGLCAYLAYSLWTQEPSRPAVSAEPVANPGAAVPLEKQGGPSSLVGTWRLSTPDAHTDLDFLSDGHVISRTGRKGHKGTYEVKQSRITLRFPAETIYWERRELPNRFVISGNELVLYSGRADIGAGPVYRFRRLEASTSPDVAAVAPAQ
jgi:hypothetical protein